MHEPTTTTVSTAEEKVGKKPRVWKETTLWRPQSRTYLFLNQTNPCFQILSFFELRVYLKTLQSIYAANVVQKGATLIVDRPVEQDIQNAISNSKISLFQLSTLGHPVLVSPFTSPPFKYRLRGNFLPWKSFQAINANERRESARIYFFRVVHCWWAACPAVV